MSLLSFKSVVFKYDWFLAFEVKFRLNYLVTFIIYNGFIFSENISFNRPKGLNESTDIFKGKSFFKLTFFTIFFAT